MTVPTQSGPLYREPGTSARLFVYAFALSSPLLTVLAGLMPAAIWARSGSWAIASVATLGYVLGLALAVKRVRILAARFTPPLPLPGDIWNIGVAEPPRRSRNWPIRFRRRRGSPGGATTRTHVRLAA